MIRRSVERDAEDCDEFEPSGHRCEENDEGRMCLCGFPLRAHRDDVIAETDTSLAPAAYRAVEAERRERSYEHDVTEWRPLSADQYRDHDRDD